MTTTASAVERIDIGPRQLLVDLNIRLDERLDKDFVTSIKDLGVLMPIVAVRTTGGELRVRFGQSPSNGGSNPSRTRHRACRSNR